MTGARWQDRQARAELRAFVRANHPDVGGDPDTFTAGLAALRARSAPSADRYDAPVEVVARPHGLRGLLRRWRAWRARRRRGPRVR